MSETKALRVLFQGDSTTDCGRNYDDPWSLGEGYVKYFVSSWADEAIDDEGNESPILYMNRGISGNRTIDIVNRFQKDIADLEPDVVFLLIGINNIWRAIDSNDPTDEDVFRSELLHIVRRIKELPSHPKLVIMEPFLLPNQVSYEPFRRLLDPALQITRSIASEYADLFIPLDGLLNACALNGVGADALSGDGVHLTDEGNETIADFIKDYLLNETDGTIL